MIKWIRQAYKGVSWQNRIINCGFKFIDIPDTVARGYRGLAVLPRYSVRVRSRGVANQFGGHLFSEQGFFMLSLLEEHANIDPSCDILEIGCGCGCAAIAIADYLHGGTYRGLDIDRISIESCARNRAFQDKDFEFRWMDIYSAQYNPTGIVNASEFVFPYDDASADVVFLTSVFTHMLPADVENYIREISRVLRPGGRLLFTAFLMDHGTDGASISFPFVFGSCRIHQQSVPERAVGYFHKSFEQICGEATLMPLKPPILGNWRTCSADGEDRELHFGQDVLVYAKDG